MSVEPTLDNAVWMPDLNSVVLLCDDPCDECANIEDGSGWLIGVRAINGDNTTWLATVFHDAQKELLINLEEAVWKKK